MPRHRPQKQKTSKHQHMKTAHQDSKAQVRSMERYYRLQSKIYDLTRWSFLFGRESVIKDIPIERNAEINILEVGCGTGYNTKILAETFTNANITAYEVSKDMVRRSRKKMARFGQRVQILHEPYGTALEANRGKFDACLFSYSLTMINPQWEDLLQQAYQDLKVGGYIAVVDFHNSKFEWFKQHMGNNHVRMDGHLLPLLRGLFDPTVAEVKEAYGGVWEYVLFVGKKIDWGI